MVYDKMALKASKLFSMNEKEIQNSSRMMGTWSDSEFSPYLLNEFDRWYLKAVRATSPECGDAENIVGRHAGWKVMAPGWISHYWIAKWALNIICSALISPFQKN